MSLLKLLFVEDDESDLNTYHSTLKRYKKQNTERQIETVTAATKNRALDVLDNSFDAAIIDLKLADKGDEGNDVIREIHNRYRIPIAVFTGTPDNVDSDLNFIGVFKKGETGYDEILNELYDVYDTGITRIMGGRGIIEKTMNRIFWNNILPHLEIWKNYGRSESLRTEKALLRYTLNHLIQILDDDEFCFPEEMYIFPPLSENLKTGSIVKQKDGDTCYVVLNPACDLVLRNSGEIKTDRIMLLETENVNNVVNPALNEITNKSKKEKKLKNIFGNNYTDYYHWLPKTIFFHGGFLNFRKISTLTQVDFEDSFENPGIQISPHFVKDILSRFSSYYARQGQPDIDQKKIIDEIIAASQGSF